MRYTYVLGLFNCGIFTFGFNIQFLKTVLTSSESNLTVKSIFVYQIDAYNLISTKFVLLLCYINSFGDHTFHVQVMHLLSLYGVIFRHGYKVTAPFLAPYQTGFTNLCFIF